MGLCTRRLLESATFGQLGRCNAPAEPVTWRDTAGVGSLSPAPALFLKWMGLCQIALPRQQNTCLGLLLFT